MAEWGGVEVAKQAGVKWAYILKDKQEAERTNWTSKPDPCGILLPTRSHFLNLYDQDYQLGSESSSAWEYIGYLFKPPQLNIYF